MRNDKNNDQSNAFGNRHMNRIIVDDGIIKQELHIPPDFFHCRLFFGYAQF